MPKDEKQLRKALAEIEKKSVAEGWHAAVTCLKLAHAHNTYGSKEEAVANYLRAADHYAETGFDLKVAVVLKQLLKVAPDHAVAQERLSTLVAGMEHPPVPTGEHKVITPQEKPKGTDAWAIVTDKIKRERPAPVAAVVPPVEQPAAPVPPPAAPAAAPRRRSNSRQDLPALDVSGRVRPVGGPVRPLLLVDGRDQHAHARRLDVSGSWNVAMACQPLLDDGEAHALVLLKGPRAFVGLADGARDRPGGQPAADRVCVEIRRLRSAVEPAVALQTVDRVLSEVPGGGQATGMLVSVTQDSVMGASVGDVVLYNFHHNRLTVLNPAQNRDRLLGSGNAAVASFESPWEGTLLAATAGAAKFLSERALSQCLAMPDVGEAAQALLAGVKLPNGTQREDAMVVVLRRGES